MEIKTLIEASADVVRIVKLAEGSVYKRINESNYNGRSNLILGVVQTVMNNGNDGAFTAIEFSADGYTPKAELIAHRNTADLAIFAATPEEVTAHVGELALMTQRKIAAAENELAVAKGLHAAVLALLGNTAALMAPATTLSVTESKES